MCQTDTPQARPPLGPLLCAGWKELSCPFVGTQTSFRPGQAQARTLVSVFQLPPLPKAFPRGPTWCPSQPKPASELVGCPGGPERSGFLPGWGTVHPGRWSAGLCGRHPDPSTLHLGRC